MIAKASRLQGLRSTPAIVRRGVMALLLGAPLLLVNPGAMPAARAIPLLDLKPYPAPAAGERRWVIQLPGVLPPTADTAISANPAD